MFCTNCTVQNSWELYDIDNTVCRGSKADVDAISTHYTVAPPLRCYRLQLLPAAGAHGKVDVFSSAVG